MGDMTIVHDWQSALLMLPLMLLTHIRSMFPKPEVFWCSYGVENGTLAYNRLGSITVNVLIYFNGWHYYAVSAKDLPKTS